MQTILLIAADTLRALRRKRLLLGFVTASLALTVAFSIGIDQMQEAAAKRSEIRTGEVTGTGAAAGAKQLSEAERREVAETFAMTGQAFLYWAVRLAGNLFALFLFTTAVAAEVHSGTIRMTLSRPVTRTQFLLGKYLGCIVAMVLFSAIAGACLAVFAQTQHVETTAAHRWVPLLMGCEHLMLGSVAMLLSLLLSPATAAVLAFWGNAALFVWFKPLYVLLPTYAPFGVMGQLWTGTLVTPHEAFLATMYAADMAIVGLLLAHLRFRTMEIVRVDR